MRNDFTSLSLGDALLKTPRKLVLIPRSTVRSATRSASAGAAGAAGAPSTAAALAGSELLALSIAVASGAPMTTTGSMGATSL
jgi:hypothetical protein